jgi:hypothetical protein
MPACAIRRYAWPVARLDPPGCPEPKTEFSQDGSVATAGAESGVTRLAGSGNIDLQGVSKKTPAGEFMRCPLNLNSNNHNQHDGSPCFYLAVQPSPESSIVFATANVSLCYPNPFRRSLQCEIQHWP